MAVVPQQSVSVDTFCLLLVVTSHMVLKVFAWQLLLFGIVFRLMLFLRNSPNILLTPEVSPFPFSLCHCLATHLSASDSFMTTALYKSIYLLTYLQDSSDITHWLTSPLSVSLSFINLHLLQTTASCLQISHFSNLYNLLPSTTFLVFSTLNTLHFTHSLLTANYIYQLNISTVSIC